MSGDFNIVREALTAGDQWIALAALDRLEAERDALAVSIQFWEAEVAQLREALDGFYDLIGEWFAGDIPPQITTDHRAGVARAALGETT